MKRLFNYLTHGKGIGLLPIFGLALIFWGVSALIINNTFKSFLNEPKTVDLINQIPAFDIENGHITNPVISEQKHTLPIGDDMVITLIINTQTDEKPALDFEQGIYVTANALYLKNTGGEQALRLPAELTQSVTPEVFKNMLFRVAGLASLILGLLPIVIILFGFLIVYLFVLALGVLINTRFTFSQWGRAAAVSWMASVIGFSGVFFITERLNIVYVIAFAVILSLILALKSTKFLSIK